MFNMIDMNKSGKLEFSEFLLCCIPEETILTMENVAIVYKLFDGDGSGCICKNEVQSVFQKYGKKITREVAQQAIEQIDKDGNGDLSFEEYSFLIKNDVQ